EKVISQLGENFSLKDLGELHQFLGMEVHKTEKGLFLSQERYAQDLLSRLSMYNAKGCKSPMSTSCILSKNKSDSSIDGTLFRRIVGSLQYLTISRPEISYAVNKVSQYMSHPHEEHWKAIKRILKYISGSTHLGLEIAKSDNLSVVGFCDSDWAADLDDRRSTSGFCVYIGGNLVSWSSRKQASVSKSSAEAEYKSLAHVTSEVLWILSLLGELHFQSATKPSLEHHPQPPFSVNLVQSVKKEACLDLWHKRLGHCSYEIVKSVLKSCNQSFDLNTNVTLCSICVVSKIHKLPFNDSETEYTLPFELVHSDLWGPSPIKSKTSHLYYLNFVDQFTKFTWIFFLKQKFEVFDIFLHFKTMVETQFGFKIKNLQTDWGGEYRSLDPFLQSNGITHRVSCPYTPQQNGTAERKHRHITEMGLSLLNQSSLPLNHWDDAFATL
ncbi:Uncharacterized mitochondrial protein AtMg00810, partial [Striga hermonthica]